MSHSLRSKLRCLRYKGILEDKDYKRLCHALDLEKAEQERCDDVVSRQAVLKCLERGDTLSSIDHRLVDEIKRLPPVRPQPKTGHWNLLDECANSGYYCSECQKKLVKEGWSKTVKKIKFCPNCGARMVEPQESEDEECINH